MRSQTLTILHIKYIIYCYITLKNKARVKLLIIKNKNIEENSKE